MKKIKLLLAAVVAMVGLSAQAQSWTASEVGAGSFVLYNVGSGQYFTKGNGYGTQASITSNGAAASGLQVTLEAVGDYYKIRTDVGTSGYGVEHLSGGSIYTDQSRNKNTTWEFSQVSTDNGPVYTILAKENHGGGSDVYMAANADNTIVGPGTDGTSAYAQWKLLAAAQVPIVAAIDEYVTVRTTVLGFKNNTSAYTDESGAADALQAAIDAQNEAVDAATTVDEINAAKEAVFAAGNTFLSSIIITSGFDITNAWITNPAPGTSGTMNGWTNSGDPSLEYQLYEYWSVSGATTKQTLSNLPKGAYKLTAIAYTRTGMVATLYAGENTMNIATVASATVNNRNQGNTWIAAGNGVNDLNFTLDEATESLEIGLIADNTTSDYWMCWRSFTLTYYGDPINLSKVDLANAVAAAEAYEGKIPSAAYAEISTVVTANNTTYDTVDEYNAAIAAINAAVEEYATAAIVADYARYQTVKTAAVAIAADTDVNDADDAVDAATTTEAIDAAIATLRAAFMAELPNVTIEEGSYIDVTNVLVDNPTVSVNTDYWTAELNGSDKTSGSWAVVNYGETEFYNNNFKFYQTLAMTPGTWEFGVTGFHRAGNHSTYFYAGEDKILIPGVESSVVNTMAAAKTYFDNGNGQVALKFLIEEAGDVEIGIDNQDTETDKWTIFRNFTLKYYGAPDYSVYADQLAAAVEAAVAVEGTVPEAVYATLDAVVEAYNQTYPKKAGYLAAIEAITAATATATATQSAYAAYEVELEAAKALAAVESDNDEARDLLQYAIDAAAGAAEAATTVDEINVAAATLKPAMTTYVFAANPVGDDAKFDCTFLLTNPDVSGFAAWTGVADVPGWYTDQEDGNSQTMTNDAATSEDGTKTHFFEYWSEVAKDNNAFALYQKVTLPAGTYDFSCYAFASANGVAGATNSAVYFYANDTQGGLVNTERLTEASISFVNSVEQEVKVGLKPMTGNQFRWMGIGYVELYKVAEKVIELDETVAYEPVSAAGNVTLVKEIAEGWNTIVLPFAVDAETVAAQFGEGQLYQYAGDNEGVLNFTEADAIMPDVPYLFKADAANDAVKEFNGVTITTGTPVAAGTNYNFVGTYAPTTVEAGNYVLVPGKFVMTAGGNALKAFRAYIQANEETEVKALTININGVATAIESIDGEQIAAGAIYNIAGQRVARAQKGIFIVGGKKIVR